MWMPSNLLGIVSGLYDLKKDNFLLTFQEILYKMDKPRIEDPLYLLGEELDIPINEMGLDVWQGVNPDVFPRDISGIAMMKCDFWECYCAAINTGLFRYLNGFNEKLDYGNDCNEKDIMYRAKIFGVDNYLVNIPVWQINHHLWEDDLYIRPKGDSNLGTFGTYIKRIIDGEESPTPPNNIRLCDNYIGADNTNQPLYDKSLYDHIKDDLLSADEYVEIGDTFGEYAIKLRADELYKRIHIYSRYPWHSQRCGINLMTNRVKCGNSLYKSGDIYVPPFINNPNIKSNLINRQLHTEDIDIFSNLAVIKINTDVIDIIKKISIYLQNDNHIVYITIDKDIFANVFEIMYELGYDQFDIFTFAIRFTKSKRHSLNGDLYPNH